MGCAISCALKYVIMVINFIVMLGFIAVCVIGGLLMWGKEALLSFMKFLIPQITAAMDLENNEETMALVNLILESTLKIGLIIMITGAVGAGICFLGCCSACCGYNCLLKVYILLISILTIPQIISLIIFAANSPLMYSFFTTLMKDSLTKYKGAPSNDTYTHFWDVLMILAQCCGMEGGKDFSTIAGFSTNDTSKQKYPSACCKHDNKLNIKDKSCPGEFTSINSNYNTGCRESLQKIVDEEKPQIILVGVGIIAIQVVLAIIGSIATYCSGKVAPV